MATATSALTAHPYEEHESKFKTLLAHHLSDVKDPHATYGKKATQDLICSLGLDVANKQVLELCCGDGSRACFIGKRYGHDITGIDTAGNTIDLAAENARRDGLADHVRFQETSAFHLPFADESFDVIYGQDPDVLSHVHRHQVFKECFRVLRPGGLFGFFHHWIPGVHFPKMALEAVESHTEQIGLASMHGANADRYLHDMKSVGFAVLSTDDMTELAAISMRTMANSLGKMGRDASPRHSALEAWVKKHLEFIDRGYHYGIKVLARKPMPGDVAPDAPWWALKSSTPGSFGYIVAGAVIAVAALSVVAARLRK